MSRLLPPYFILALNTLTVVAGQSWELQYEHPDGYLLDIFFADVMNGWIVGTDGIVLHSTNSGFSWHDHDIGTDSTLTSVYFSDIENGWLVGFGGTVFHTADAGSTWVAQKSGVAEFLMDLSFVNDTIGWAVGGDYGTGYIVKTEDGGKSWSRVGEEETFGGMYFGVDFVSIDEGWVVGMEPGFDNFVEEVIWHTLDGGESWQRQHSPILGPLFDVDFLTTEMGWACQDQAVIETTDGGTTWTQVKYSNMDIFSDIAVTDSSNIWAAGSRHIFHSSDAGSTWINEWDWTEWHGTSTGLSMVDSLRGWAVAGSAILVYSENTNSIFQDRGLPLPLEPSLEQNYPNPFNSNTSIRYSLSKDEYIYLEIYDLVGRKALTIYSGFESAGGHVRTFNSPNLASGIYFVRLKTSDFIGRRKILVIR